MKFFHCDHCASAVFFENVQCLHCSSRLAFLPDRLTLNAVEQVPEEDGQWRRKGSNQPSGSHYRLCQNNTQHKACNFAVPGDDPNPLCVCCRLTEILPDLSTPGNHMRWYRIEAAKRRLFYTLARLGLVSVNPPNGQRDGPVFQFLADQPGMAVMTGHWNGLITLNIAEADDDERVRRRLQLREPYRTLLGHLRHESGHYYWDGPSSATNRRITASRCRRTTPQARRPAGRTTSSAPTRRPIPGRTGPRRGPITCTWWTCWKPRPRTTPGSPCLARKTTWTK
jgi:hypothetical protein